MEKKEFLLLNYLRDIIGEKFSIDYLLNHDYFLRENSGYKGYKSFFLIKAKL